MEQSNKTPPNVFVIAHEGSVRKLAGWIAEQGLVNYFNLYTDKRGTKFFGLQFINPMQVREPRGILVFKDDSFMPQVEKILNEIVNGE